MCEDFHCLPFSGGLLEQPARKVEAMKIIRNIITEYKARQTEKLNRDIRAKEAIERGNGKGNNSL
jgi:hypothetical protein